MKKRGLGVVSFAYLSEAESRGAGKYVSPDKKIDASACLLPDHTWFIRDVAHRSMPEGINSLFEAILDHEGYMTVFDDSAFSQYLSNDSETDSLSAVEPSSAPGGGIGVLRAYRGLFPPPVQRDREAVQRVSSDPLLIFVIS